MGFALSYVLLVLLVLHASSEEDGLDLIKAAIRNDVDEISFLLGEGESIGATDDEGGTALHHASFRGHLDSIKLLLSHGASLTANARNGGAPLHFAAIGDQPAAIWLLLRRGADLEGRTDCRGRDDCDDGMTPLISAAAVGGVSAVEALILAGASLEVRLQPSNRHTGGDAYAIAEANRHFNVTAVLDAAWKRRGKRAYRRWSDARIARNAAEQLGIDPVDFDPSRVRKVRVPTKAGGGIRSPGDEQRASAASPAVTDESTAPRTDLHAKAAVSEDFDLEAAKAEL